jgi:hypothetical protein
VDIEAVPPLTDSEARALRDALDRAGVRLELAPAAYDTAWRRASVAEATDDVEHLSPEALPLYAPSPRSTRGATRA